MSELVIGSRRSKLALRQANHIAAQLTAHGHTTEIRRNFVRDEGWQTIEDIRRMFKLETPE